MFNDDSQPIRELAWLSHYYRQRGHLAEAEEIKSQIEQLQSCQNVVTFEQPEKRKEA